MALIARRLIQSAASPFRSISRGLLVGTVFLFGCTVAVSPLAALDGQQKSPARSAPTKAPARAGAAPVPGAPAAPAGEEAGLLQRRRRAIALMLEGTVAYRGVILDDEAPRIVEPKLAGPFEYNRRENLFSSSTVKDTLYCVSAGVRVAFFPPAWRTTLIRVVQAADGRELLRATTSLRYTPTQCNKAPYAPFPEFEQIRAQRRKALGKEV